MKNQIILLLLILGIVYVAIEELHPNGKKFIMRIIEGNFNVDIGTKTEPEVSAPEMPFKDKESKPIPISGAAHKKAELRWV